MTVSIEGFFLRNFGMDALILLLAARLSRIRVRGYRLLLSAGFGGVYAVCACFSWGCFLQGILPKTAAVLVMTALLYGKTQPGIRQFLRTAGMVWVATLLLGGTGAGVMVMMGQKGYAFLPALLTALLGTLTVLFLTVRRNAADICPVAELEVKIADKSVCFSASVDTGNVLVEPLSNLPVIVVEKAMLKGLEQGRSTRPVPYVTVGGSGCLKAFLPEKVLVDGREVMAFVAPCEECLSMEGHGLIPGRCLQK